MIIYDFFKRIVLLAFHRDTQREKFILLCSRLELFLRNTLGTPRMLEWLSGVQAGENFYCANGQICLKWNTPLQPLPGAVTVTLYFPLERQPECEPVITRLGVNFGVIFGPPSEFLLNGLPEYQTPFTALRLYSSTQPVPVIMSEELQRADHPWTSFPERLVLYDSISVNYLAHKFGIKDQLVIEDDRSNDAAWRRSYIDMGASYDANAELIPFRTSNGTLAFNLELLPSGNKSILLAGGFYQHRNFPKPLRLYIPPRPPFCLYNADRVIQNPDATIIFTDELATALSNKSNPALVFCSYYGGDEAIPYLDVSPQAGRHVLWLMLDKPGSTDPKAKYVTAVKIAKQLNGHNVNLEFVTFSDLKWQLNNYSRPLFEGVKTGIKIIRQEEMLEEAARQGVYIPEELRVIKTSNIEGDDLEKKEKLPFLISPIIRKASGTVIFGGTGAAKSWTAISIGAAAANGKSVFPDRWPVMNPDGIKCLTIAGEMDIGEYGERLKRLHQHYAKDEEHKKNFILHIGDQLDIASPEGFDRLNEIIDDAENNCGISGQPVELLILDNLTTLSIEGENPANFGRIEYALKSIKARGISVILIHHENLKGDIRGARKISDVMDMKLHLFKANKDDKIGIIVKNEKIRSGKQSEFATFKAMLDVDATGTGWVVSEPTPEELEAIGEDEDSSDDAPEPSANKVPKTQYGLTAWAWLSDEQRVNSVKAQRLKGLTNAQIAANHTTSRTVVSTFRQEKGIRDCDLRVNGFNPTGSEE